jgi:hypothetical protein
MWWLLLACGAGLDADALPYGDLGPPSFIWRGTEQVAGEQLRFAANLPTIAGRQVVLYAALARTAGGACAPRIPGACVALQAPVKLGTVVPDAAGDILLELPWTTVLAGRQQLFVQGVVVDPGGSVRGASRVWTYAILSGYGDADRDGLRDSAEWQARSDLHRFDTDGGGTGDAQEVTIDHTDPNQAADDLHREAACENGVDDDGDARTDCDDADCATAGACEARACDDGLDGDHDGLVDCVDPDCDMDRVCAEDCDNRTDDDGDGHADCQDGACAQHLGCSEGDCADGFDGQDGDGLRDCADPECMGPVTCHERSCTNGADDDGDALVDCEDADCAFGAPCAELQCADGSDDDQDGQIDCDDDDCWTADCHLSTIAWTVTGNFSEHLYRGMPFSMGASEVWGRVRVEGPRLGVQSCTWTVGRVHWPVYQAFMRPSVYLAFREGFTITPGCEVGPEVLPRLGSALWSGWYAPVVSRQSQTFVGYHWFDTFTGGPFLRAEPHGRCVGGSAPALAFDDADGDGYGVAEPFDMFGAIGGRRFVCGAVPRGMTPLGGDCDDGDATWSPATVVPAFGVPCTGLSPDDRDGDGVRAPSDPDDHNALIP